MLQARKKTDLIVVHCSATKASMDIGVRELDRMHRARGFSCIGYHKVIRRDGSVEDGRPIGTVGAHVEGRNHDSVGVCMVGGVDAGGIKGEDNFTPAQFDTLEKVLRDLRQTFGHVLICGHRDLSPDLNHDGKISPNEWMKECPSFSVLDYLNRRGI